MSIVSSRRVTHERFPEELPHYVKDEDGIFVHRPGYCTLTDRYYGPPVTFGTQPARMGWIRPVRVIMLALAIAFGIAGLTLTGLIFAVGVVALTPWDRS